MENRLPFLWVKGKEEKMKFTNAFAVDCYREFERGGDVMESPKDDRCDKRHQCEIPIHVYGVNSTNAVDALMVNHSTNGIGFKSNASFPEGMAIVFKINYSMVNHSCVNDLENLPSISLGEVAWCRKFPADPSSTYGIGVKYFPQFY
jgi:hypothetical protein